MIEEYSIISLVLLYLAVNVWYRNLKSILLFLVSLVSLYPIVKNKLYAIVIAYVISIAYNIVKNFHLLENFSSNVKKSKSHIPIIIPSNIQELKRMSTLIEKNPPKNNESKKSWYRSCS